MPLLTYPRGNLISSAWWQVVGASIARMIQNDLRKHAWKPPFNSAFSWNYMLLHEV